MLADASISRADVSKAKPPVPLSALRHMHVGRRPQRGSSMEVSVAVAARHTGCRRPQPRRRAGAWSAPRRGGPARGRRWGEEGRRGGVSGRAAASRRAPTSGTEMHGEGKRRRGQARRCREMVLRACRGGAGRRRGAAQLGEERRRWGRARRGRRARFGGKWLSALRFIPNAHLLSRFVLATELRLKETFLSRLVIRTVTKGAFARDTLKGNFRPFVMVGVTTRDKRESFSLGW
jgi:hypothetical protein